MPTDDVVEHQSPKRKRGGQRSEYTAHLPLYSM